MGLPCVRLRSDTSRWKKIPEWRPRSRRGQFLGFSATHSSTIGLIRNLRTGNVSPQFHVVYDDYHQIIPTDGTNEVDSAEMWSQLLSTSSEKYLPDWDKPDLEPPPLNTEWLTGEEAQQRPLRLRRVPLVQISPPPQPPPFPHQPPHQPPQQPPHQPPQQPPHQPPHQPPQQPP